MGILQIRQTTNSGQSKVWKIDSKDKRVTIGTSRKADLSSIDQTYSPFQGVVEFTNNKWYFIQFEFDVKNPLIEIIHNTEINFRNSSIQFQLIEKPEFVSAQLNAVQTSGPLQRKIVIVSKESRILQTHVSEVNTPFYYGLNGNKHEIKFNSSTNWDTHTIEDFNFKSKIIQVEDLKGISRLPSEKMIDGESKKLLYATLLSMFVFVSIGLFANKKEDIVSTPVQMSAQNIVVKMDKKIDKIKKLQHKAQTSNNKPVAANKKENTQQPAQASAAASTNKVSALLKGAIGARISQLVGKVSATDARTANVITTAQGVKAGNGPSGRALAALGNMDSSGRNWNGEATGSATGQVSTAGIAGGRGIAGLGSGLAAGKTGKGGVGLLEDESEVDGGLDKEIIAQYIKSQLGHLLNCYDRQLAVHKELGGKVSVKFIISKTGQVEAQNITETEMKNQPTESCMLSKISKWKFPEPKGGTKVVVTYPFMFKSTN